MTVVSAPASAGDDHLAASPARAGGLLRSTARVGLLGLWSALSFLLWLAGWLVAAGSARRRLRWRHWLLRRWARGVARLLGVRVAIVGQPPDAPFFLVANHLSYVDIILLYTQLDCVFIAKREMRGWPFLGFLAHVMDTIWVNRDSRRDALRVLEDIDEAVARGDGVVLFPEGTTSAGDGLLPMKPALFDWAARRDYPVHCAAITYRTEPGAPPAHLTVCWWGDMTFGPHVRNLCRLRRFDARIEFFAETISAPDRTRLAGRARDAILGRFEPVVSTERLGP
ncbi:MAG: lysophospholipid acyltransferase family protein [Gemmatimonadales bacterium]